MLKYRLEIGRYLPVNTYISGSGGSNGEGLLRGLVSEGGLVDDAVGVPVCEISVSNTKDSLPPLSKEHVLGIRMTL